VPVALGSENVKDPAGVNVHVPLCPACSVNGLGEQVAPAVGLKATWWTTVSLFLNCTVSAVVAVTVLGVKPLLVIETGTVAAPAIGTATRAIAATARAQIVRIRITPPALWIGVDERLRPGSTANALSESARHRGRPWWSSLSASFPRKAAINAVSGPQTN